MLAERSNLSLGAIEAGQTVCSCGACVVRRSLSGRGSARQRLYRIHSCAIANRLCELRIG
jgi:hypothetical protein